MRKRIVLFLILLIVCESRAVPKPMESLTNYNVLLLHGAYGHTDADGVLQGFEENSTLQSAYFASEYLGKANIGKYDSKKRLGYFISKEIFEESDSKQNVHDSYIYHWRSFSEPPSSSITNAVELGDRTWNRAENGTSKFGHRRALVEEAQEVKAAVYDTTEKRLSMGKMLLILSAKTQIFTDNWHHVIFLSVIRWVALLLVNMCRPIFTIKMWTR